MWKSPKLTLPTNEGGKCFEQVSTHFSFISALETHFIINLAQNNATPWYSPYNKHVLYVFPRTSLRIVYEPTKINHNEGFQCGAPACTLRPVVVAEDSREALQGLVNSDPKCFFGVGDSTPAPICSGRQLHFAPRWYLHKQLFVYSSV